MFHIREACIVLSAVSHAAMCTEHRIHTSECLGVVIRLQSCHPQLPPPSGRVCQLPLKLLAADCAAEPCGAVFFALIDVRQLAPD